MIVRLKVPHNGRAFGEVRSFNSMIVRLKVESTIIVPSTSSFQFYDSPIKRARAAMLENPERRFNSMIVRLKGRQRDSERVKKCVSIL